MTTHHLPYLKDIDDAEEVDVRLRIGSRRASAYAPAIGAEDRRVLPRRINSERGLGAIAVPALPLLVHQHLHLYHE